MDLAYYDFKEKIKVILKSGTIFIGESEDFFRKEDFDSEYDELAINVHKIIVDKGDLKYTQLSISEDEIESIEIL